MIMLTGSFYATSFLLHPFRLALLASSLPLSAFAIDEAKKEIVIGTTVGDFADMVTDAIKPQLEAKGWKGQTGGVHRLRDSQHRPGGRVA